MTDIRLLQRDEFDAWLPLWQGYQRFYRTEMTEAHNRLVWQRLMALNEPMWVLGAFTRAAWSASRIWFFIAAPGPRATTAICRTCMSPRICAAAASAGN